MFLAVVLKISLNAVCLIFARALHIAGVWIFLFSVSQNACVSKSIGLPVFPSTK